MTTKLSQDSQAITSKLEAQVLQLNAQSNLPMQLKKIEKGLVVFELKADKHSINALGNVQSGFAATVLENINHYVAQTVLTAGFSCQMTDLSLKFCQPLPAHSLLVAEAKVRNMGRTILLTEGYIWDQEGELYAYASSTHVMLKPILNQ